MPRNKPKPAPGTAIDLKKSPNKSDPPESSPRTLIRKNVRGCLPVPPPSAKPPTEQESLLGKAADTKSSDKSGPQEPKEQESDRDEWELIDEPELDEEIDAVLVEREPNLTKSNVRKQKSESDPQFEKIAKKLRSDLDAWSHAADRPKLARWSAKDGEITYEGYIVDGVVLKVNRSR
jgi:hypothetical protein